MKRLFAVTAALALLGLSIAAQAAITIETVAVGDAGNGPDPLPGLAGYGAVGYGYDVGKYEVTAGQYTAFLNAVAATDTYGLYNNLFMSITTYGSGITRSGASGSYTYSVASDFVNRPVNYVSWGDCARFVNWLHNGQPTGLQVASTTEDGAYYLNGAVTAQALNTVTRKGGWKWALCTEDEWYKAAYYKGGGTNAGYWLYPTSSDSIGTGMANYGGSVGHTTDVGSYGLSSAYGTFDQGGNVWEWIETIRVYTGATYRCARGGGYSSSSGPLRASPSATNDPTIEAPINGFRVCEAPEPSPIIALAGGLVGLLGIRRRRV